MIDDRTDRKLLEAVEPGHPVLPWSRQRAVAYLERHGVRGYNAMMERRNEAIRLEKADPYNYGVELAIWKLGDVLWGWISWEEFLQDAQVPVAWKESRLLERWLRECGPVRSFLISGGNRASKTEYMCKRMVQAAMRYEHAAMWLFHETWSMSVAYHHALIYKYLPLEVKDAGKTKVAYVSYNQQNGFSGDKVTFPTGSYIEFKNYGIDPKTIEGGNLGDPGKRPCPGAVGDEAMPYNFFRTLKYRCTTNRSLRLNGYTALAGWDDVMEVYLGGRTDVLMGDAKIPGVDDAMPLLSRDVTGTLGTVFFHSHFNPYSDFRDLQRDVMTEPRDERIVRMAGMPYKRKQALFPKYRDAIHRFALERLPQYGTRYVYVDPAGRKNWFVCWVLVDVYDRYWVYREWPCAKVSIPGIGYPEAWAVAGSNETHRFGGVPGGGSKPFGLTLLDYKNEFARLEGWHDLKRDMPPEQWRESNGMDEVIYARFMDAKFANTGRQNAYDNTTLLEECAEIGLCFESIAGTGTTETDVKLIDNLLGYSQQWYERWQAAQTDANVEVPIEGGPRLFICEDCENIDFALKQFTGQGGTKEATKDPVDVLKFLACGAPQYVEGRKRKRGGVRGYGGPAIGMDAVPGDAPDKKRRLLEQARRQAGMRRRYGRR